jgi:hypothetical protein
MDGSRERWMELAELASKEQDPDRMMELIREINEILERKQQRLDSTRVPPPK